MNVLIGLSLVISLIVLIYILGLIPNLWSNKLIHYTSLEEVLHRGFTIIIIAIVITVFIFLFHQIGEIARSFT